jgi:hypothetical protein
VQRLLKRLHIGVVGVGGTGSAVAEQLTRLGVGRLTTIDHDKLESTNVNRVYGSGLFDAGAQKTAIVARQAAHIGFETKIRRVDRHLSFKSSAEALKTCDLVFGCTDDEWGRSILSRLSIYFGIPILDLGVIVDPDPHGERIRSVQGRVTVLQPGHACLFCRERISTAGVTAESIAATDPQRAAALRNEGYITGQEAPAPAVIAFTTGTAAFAVTEMLDRLTGFKADDVKPSEFLIRFDADAIARNSKLPKADCFCGARGRWMAGDQRPFLGITWRPEA